MVDVQNFVEAKFLMDALAKYDIFQFENRIKPDYCNVGGLMEWDADEGDYCDWHPDDIELAVLTDLFGTDIAYEDTPLDNMTLEQVRQFQKRLDA